MIMLEYSARMNSVNGLDVYATLQLERSFDSSDRSKVGSFLAGLK